MSLKVFLIWWIKVKNIDGVEWGVKGALFFRLSVLA